MILYVYTRYSVILYFKIVHDEQVCMFTVHCLRKMLPLLRILVRESLQKAISATGVDLGKSSMCFTQTDLRLSLILSPDSGAHYLEMPIESGRKASQMEPRCKQRNDGKGSATASA